MMTRTLFPLASLLLASTLTTSAQRISKINFDSVKVATTTKDSRYYYPALLKRFQAADTTLTRQDFNYVYYGQVYTTHYAPYGLGNHDEFIKYYNSEQYAKAIPLGEKALANAPLDLNLLFKLLVCHYQLGNKAKAQQYAQQYFPMIRAILASGDGKGIATAYVVAVVHDEYEVLKELRLSSNSQALVGHTDVLTAVPINDDNKPTGEPARELYFDVTQPFAHMMGQFKTKK